MIPIVCQLDGTHPTCCRILPINETEQLTLWRAWMIGWMNDFRHFFTDGQNRITLGLRQQMKRVRRKSRAPEIAFWLFYSLKEEPKETLTSILWLHERARLHLWLFYGPGTIPHSVSYSLGVLAGSFPLAKPDSISFPSVLKLLDAYFVLSSASF